MCADFNLHQTFLNWQREMATRYAAVRAAITHPGSKGDESEADWAGMLRDFLPTRYQVSPVFAVDADGSVSHQIDLAVYDKQYSPQWFGAKSGFSVVPVESVYAVFEVKPELDSATMKYAAEKVASVRRLRRTSATIKHAGGRFDAADPAEKHIIGGILATKTGWTTRESALEKVAEYLLPLGQDGALDIGVGLDSVAFDRTPVPRPGDDSSIEDEARLTFSRPDQELVHFSIRLFAQLQMLGTVLALDMTEYEKSLGLFGE